MEQFNESFSTHCDEVMAAMKGDEEMRKKHPHYREQYKQMKQLFPNPKRPFS